MPDFRAQRLNMVESQVRTNDVTDVRIQEAMREIPRERFVPTSKQAVAYADTIVEIVPGRFLLDPRTFSKLAELAEIEPADRVLDVGSASGYSTAVLSRLAHEVIALEEDAELVRVATDVLPSLGISPRVVQGKLADGYAAGAPYNVIFINGGIEELPPALERQLAEGGRLVVVLRKGPQGRGYLFLREQGRMSSRADFDATVPLLAGFSRPKSFVF
ncbi:MAG TPA: protein-L-isoaspartate O-methyltransferase [Rhizomicrobium sp.]|jgi:protein-L-isoaspartate(D-aspartate) O-methyltransferase|nr:protein-L-isoaspartate O-methyltransferase [Rhizomicrobium sp.]